MKQFIINEQELNAVANFLGTCSYQQVYQIIDMLRKIPEKPEQKNEKPERKNLEIVEK